jgi:hypothetical protein
MVSSQGTTNFATVCFSEKKQAPSYLNRYYSVVEQGLLTFNLSNKKLATFWNFYSCIFLRYGALHLSSTCPKIEFFPINSLLLFALELSDFKAHMHKTRQNMRRNNFALNSLTILHNNMNLYYKICFNLAAQDNHKYP